MSEFEEIRSAGVPVKAWIKGVPVEAAARQQLINVAEMPFVFRHVAVMPDVHFGKGATVGSVIPTKGAVIPAAVGVDIGCGMCAVRTDLGAADLPDTLSGVRAAIEAVVPVGQASHKEAPRPVENAWYGKLKARYLAVEQKHPAFAPKASPALQLGTLGGGNHFIEVCLDEADRVWVMLHSGSRGVGNRFGTYFIELAKKEMRRWFVNLPYQDLAYLPEGTEHFGAYVRAVGWAQRYARVNRELMMAAVVRILYAPGDR